MLGLVILLSLGLWILITIIATVVGARKKGSKGAFIGFMLTMGGPIVYWISEYVYIQYTVNQLCNNEGGVTVYVTPEEWRKQIGEEEWEKSYYTGEKSANYPKNHLIQLKGKEYHPVAQINQRLIWYVAEDYGKHRNIYNQDTIFYDIKSQEVLYHERVFSGAGAPSISNSLNALKFWLDYGIHSCNYNKNQFFDEYQYSSPKH